MEFKLAQSPHKSRHKKIAISFAIFISIAGLIGILYKGLQIDQSVVPTVLINSPAKPFKASWIQGSEYFTGASNNYFDFKLILGRPTILNFWASWCVACRSEAKEIEEFWQHIQKSKLDLNLVGVATQDSTEAAKKFASYFGKTYPLVLDENGTAGIEYGLTGVPETVIIDKNGIIIEKIIGPVTYQGLKEVTENLLK